MSSEKFTKTNHLKDELFKILKNLEKKVSSDNFSGELFFEAERELSALSEEVYFFGERYGKNDPGFVVLKEMEEKLSNLIKNNELMRFI